MSTELLITSVTQVKAEVKTEGTVNWLHLSIDILGDPVGTSIDIFPTSSSHITLSSLAQVSQTINRELSK